MRWLGLDATALALTLLAALLALILLYLQTRPARRVVVPSLALWQAIADERRRPSALLSRARLVLSLLLAFAIAAALVFALGQPERVRAEREQNLVLLIDGSPSMAARDVAPSRFERAKAEARARVRALGEHDQAWVVALGGAALPRTERTRDHASLLRAIDALQLQPEAADLATGAALALDLLSPFAHGELALFSDGALTGEHDAVVVLGAAPKIATHFTPIGVSARNVALSQLAVRPYPLDHAHDEVLVAVSNFGDASEPLALRVSAGETLLREEHLTLASGATVTRVLSDLPRGGALLRANITLDHGRDPLPGDDQAETRLPERRPTRVLSVSAGNRYLEAALLLDDTLEVHELAPDAYRSSAGYDLVIFDGTLPNQAPSVPALYLGPPADGGVLPLSRAGELSRPFFDRVERAHPLVQELALGDVNIGRALRLTLSPGDLAVAATAANEPLIVEGQRDGQRFVVLAFDLRDSDLPLRAAFPLFFLRTLARLGGAPDSAVHSAVLNPREGAIAPQRSSFALSADAPLATREASLLARLWPVLLVAALALLAFEWLSFHRGWTA